MRRLCMLLALVACSKDAGDSPAKHEDRHEPAAAPTKFAITVTIGGTTETWSEAALADVPKMAGSANDGESRDTWSLRELVHRKVGPKARVISVTGADGKKPIDLAAWDDPARTPIVHVTRRGALKFRWADQAGAWSDTVAKGVTGLEIAP
ncbi:MAG: hypothetical protein ABI867_02820 [Kofleriaceae bacterium]